MDISRALNEVCSSRDIRQVDICRKTGISDAHMSQIFSGKIRNPKAEMMWQISKAIGVSLDELMELASKYPNG